jgi:hypothetical protein
VRVAPTKANIRHDPIDHWVLTYCSAGTTNIRTERGLLQARAGVPFLWSLGETSESQRTASDRFQVFMPRDAFRDVAPLVDQTCRSVLDTPLGRLRGDYPLALGQRLPALAADDLPRLAAAVHAMLVACIAPSADRVGVVQSIQRQRLLNAHAVLCDPGVTKSISAIAEEFCFADASSSSRA